METIELHNDLTVFCVTAKSFPEGVKEAHQQLHTLFPPAPGRRYYGISFPVKGEINYKAAAGLGNNEPVQDLNLETFVICKGKYASKVITGFMRDLSSIGRTFNELLSDIRVDPNGFCLEEYFNDNDVRCMVKLKDN